MFGGGWLKRLQNGFDGDPATQVFGGTQTPPAAAPAAPADGGFRFQREADSAVDQIKRPAGWWPKLAQVFAVTGDVGRGLEGNTPAYVPALRQRWAATAKAKATQGQNATTGEILRTALARVPEADRAGLEALIRNAPDADSAMRYIADYEQETRQRRNRREDVQWERNLPPEGMVEDPKTGELKPRPGWPVEGMAGRVYGPNGEIVARAGFEATPEGRRALAEVDLIVAQTNAAKANAAESNANANYINNGKGKGGVDFGDENTLRGQYLKQTEALQSVAESYNKVKSLAVQASRSPNPGPADIGVVFSIMKMHDPSSTVREGEFATAENAGGVPQSVTAAYNKLLNGGRLAPEIRQEFVNVAGTLYQQAQARRGTLDQDFRALALRYGMNPDAIVVGSQRPAPPGPPAPGKPGTGNGTIDRLSQGAGGGAPDPFGILGR